MSERIFAILHTKATLTCAPVHVAPPDLCRAEAGVLLNKPRLGKRCSVHSSTEPSTHPDWVQTAGASQGLQGPGVSGCWQPAGRTGGLRSSKHWTLSQPESQAAALPFASQGSKGHRMKITPACLLLITQSRHVGRAGELTPPPQ